VLDSINASVEEQVSMFLHVVGHNQRYKVVHQSFRMSIETVHRHFHQVLYAVGEFRSEMIKPPGLETHPKIFGSQRWNPYFKVLYLISLVAGLGFLSGIHVICSNEMLFRTALGLLIAPMCWLGCLDTCRLPSRVGRVTHSKCYDCCGL
jgi:hypothetical protein